MKLSDLTPADIRELRVLAAIELAYPVQHQAMGDKRASVTLARWKAMHDTAERRRNPGKTT